MKSLAGMLRANSSLDYDGEMRCCFHMRLKMCGFLEVSFQYLAPFARARKGLNETQAPQGGAIVQQGIRNGCQLSGILRLPQFRPARGAFWCREVLNPALASRVMNYEPDISENERSNRTCSRLFERKKLGLKLPHKALLVQPRVNSYICAPIGAMAQLVSALP